jgi:hypothetical protein
VGHRHWEALGRRADHLLLIMPDGRR